MLIGERATKALAERMAAGLVVTVTGYKCDRASGGLVPTADGSGSKRPASAISQVPIDVD